MAEQRPPPTSASPAPPPPRTRSISTPSSSAPKPTTSTATSDRTASPSPLSNNPARGISPRASSIVPSQRRVVPSRGANTTNLGGGTGTPRVGTPTGTPRAGTPTTPPERVGTPTDDSSQMQMWARTVKAHHDSKMLAVQGQQAAEARVRELEVRVKKQEEELTRMVRKQQQQGSSAAAGSPALDQTIRDSNAMAEEELESLQEEYDLMAGRCAALGEGMKVSQAKIQALETMVGSMKTELGNKERRMLNLEVNLKEAENRLVQSQAEVRERDGKLRKLRGDRGSVVSVASVNTTKRVTALRMSLVELETVKQMELDEVKATFVELLKDKDDEIAQLMGSLERKVRSTSATPTATTIPEEPTAELLQTLHRRTSQLHTLERKLLTLHESSITSPTSTTATTAPESKHTLLHRLQTAETSIATLTETVSALQSELAQTRTEYEDAEFRCDAMQIQHETYLRGVEERWGLERKELKDKLDTLRLAFDDERDSMLTELFNAEAAVEAERKLRGKEVKAVKEKYGKRMDEIREQMERNVEGGSGGVSVEALKAAKGRLEVTLMAAMQDKRELDRKVRVLGEQVEAGGVENRGLKEAVKELKEQVRFWEDTNGETQGLVDEMKEKVVVLEKRVRVLVEESEAEQERFKEEMKSFEDSRTALETQLSGSNEEFVGLIERLRDVEKAKLELGRDFDKLRSQMSLTVGIDDVADVEGEDAEETSENRDALSKAREKILALESKNSKLLNIISLFNVSSDRADDSQSQLASASPDAQQVGKLREEYESKLKASQLQIDALREAVDRLDQENEVFKAAELQQEGSSSSVDKEAEIQQLKEKLESSAKEVWALAGANELLDKERITSGLLQSEITNLKTVVEHLNERLNDSEAKLTDALLDLGEANKYMDELEFELNNVRGPDSASLEGSVASLRPVGKGSKAVINAGEKHPAASTESTSPPPAIPVTPASESFEPIETAIHTLHSTLATATHASVSETLTTLSALEQIESWVHILFSTLSASEEQNEAIREEGKAAELRLEASRDEVRGLEARYLVLGVKLEWLEKEAGRVEGRSGEWMIQVLIIDLNSTQIQDLETANAEIVEELRVATSEAVQTFDEFEQREAEFRRAYADLEAQLTEAQQQQRAVVAASTATTSPTRSRAVSFVDPKRTELESVVESLLQQVDVAVLEIESLQRQLERQAVELQTQTARCIQLETNLKVTKRRSVELDIESQTRAFKIKDLESEVNNGMVLRDYLDEQVEELDMLRERVVVLGVALDASCGRTRELEALYLMQGLKTDDEVESLENQLAMLEHESLETRQLLEERQQELLLVTSQLQQLQETAAASRDVRVATPDLIEMEPRVDISKLETQVTQLQEELKAVSKTNHELRRESSAVRDRLSQREAEFERALAAQLAELQSELRATSPNRAFVEYESTESVEEAPVQVISVLESQVTQLREELRRVSTTNTTLAQEASAIRNQLSRREAEFERMMAAQMVELQAELRATSPSGAARELESAESVDEIPVPELESEVEPPRKTISVLESQVTRLHEELRRVSTVNTSLEQESSAIRNQLARREAEFERMMAAQMVELQAELHASSPKRDAVELNPERADFLEREAELHSVIAALESRISELQEASSSLDTNVTKSPQVQEILAQREAEFEALLAVQLTELQHELREANAKASIALDSAASQISHREAEVQVSISRLESQVFEAQAELLLASSTNVVLEEESTHTRELLAKREAEFQILLSAQFLELQQELRAIRVSTRSSPSCAELDDPFEKQEAALQLVISKLEVRIAELEAELKLRAETPSSIAVSSSSADELLELESVIRELTEEVNTSQQEKEILGAQISELQHTIAGLESALGSSAEKSIQLETRLSESEEELENCHESPQSDQISALQEQVVNLKTTNVHIFDQLKAAEDMISSLKDQLNSSSERKLSVDDSDMQIMVKNAFEQVAKMSEERDVLIEQNEMLMHKLEALQTSNQTIKDVDAKKRGFFF
ncbi:hypothetical protein HDU98_008230 [Podochytrium sp. JEL0797]|nr:hypothetical protein HDU98_008230 [Podochytrium sp. JEL0797]